MRVIGPSTLGTAILRYQRLAVQSSKPNFRTMSSYRGTTKDWSAAQYLKFEKERTRPSRDLLAQVPLTSPKHVIDLGCGPGNSTAVIAARYPDSRIEGMDSSPDMIAKAKRTLPDVEFSLGDLKTYTPPKTADLLFSNAVFQWIPYDERVPMIKRLIEAQAPGGIFAFQVPANSGELSHKLMRDTAEEGPWAETLRKLKPWLDPFQTPQVLYDEFSPLCESVDLWYTYYQHVLDGHEAIVEWVKGTGLRPYVDPLGEEEKKAFTEMYLNKIKEAYPLSVDGKVLLQYPRLFMVATRA